MKKLLIITYLAFSAAAVAAPVDDNDLGITPEDCRMLVEHKPGADVEYIPGVDVAGKPVVEADINPSVVQAPKSYTFDINVEAAQFAGIPLPAGSQALTNVGQVTIASNGQATFNGRPLEGESMAALKAACASLYAPPALNSSPAAPK